jgi:alcohol dehydrogenase
MVNYDQPWFFNNPVRIVYGLGSIKDLPSLTPLGKGLLVTSPSFNKRGFTEDIRRAFRAKKLEIIDNVQPNPDILTVEACWKQYKDQKFQYVIGVGGGSVIDTAKTLSYLLQIEDKSFSLKDHFINNTVLPDCEPLMMIAVPTTAGTGSEVTPFATIWDHKEQKKYSLVLKNLHPSIALLDPELTLTLPKEITIITGLDALAHALESVWNRHFNPISFLYAAKAIEIVLGTLPLLSQDLQNLKYRSKLLLGSLFGGLCISATRTALAHSMSYPITAALGVPHGLACGFVLPALLKYNMFEEDGRFKQLAFMIGYDCIEEVGKRMDRVYELIGINRLMKKYQMTEENLLNLAPKMLTPERSENNLRSVNFEDIQSLISATKIL